MWPSMSLLQGFTSLIPLSLFRCTGYFVGIGLPPGHHMALMQYACVLSCILCYWSSFSVSIPRAAIISADRIK